MSFEIDFACSYPPAAQSVRSLRQALQCALQVERVAAAVLSVSIVDNATIHRLNREHLQHDYPTDVISFQLDWREAEAPPDSPVPEETTRPRLALIEGEILVSGEYAAEMAPRCGWSSEAELTLYAIHGMLHICGYDDLTASEKAIMRSRERAILKELGLSPRYPDDDDPDVPPPGSSHNDVAADSRVPSADHLPEDAE